MSHNSVIGLLRPFGVQRGFPGYGLAGA